MLPLGAAMSTPAKRHCHSPASSLDSSFQRRLRKISIEGNIGELGGGEPGLAPVAVGPGPPCGGTDGGGDALGGGRLRGLFHPPLQEGRGPG